MKNNSISRYIYLFNFILTAVFIVSIIVFYYYRFTSESKREEINQKEIYINNIKKDLINEAESINVTTDILHENYFDLVKVDLKSNLDNIHEILTTLYNTEKEKTSQDELKSLILKLIASFKNDKKNGYYFAIDMETTLTYVHSRKDFVNKTMAEIAGHKAVKIFENYKKAIDESKTNGGFAHAKVAKPNTTSLKLHDKITYIKIFEPLNIMIGIGVYLDDYEQLEKEQIRDYIAENEKYKDLDYLYLKDDNTHYELIRELEFKFNSSIQITKQEGDFIYFLSRNNEFLLYKKRINHWDLNLLRVKDLKDTKKFLDKQNIEQEIKKSEFLLNLFYIAIFSLLIGIVFINYINKKIKEKLSSYENEILVKSI